ncbi:MAG: hypothetical protein ACK59B_11965, partial [Alphaproteobacteria bacterium]
ALLDLFRRDLADVGIGKQECAVSGVCERRAVLKIFQGTPLVRARASTAGLLLDLPRVYPGLCR